jgi:threonine dehydrogenase-like Zn-dependent dehydrogenase
MSQVAAALGIAAPGEAGFFPVALPDVPEGGMRLRMLWSGFSCGTEMTFFTGTNPYLTSGWDAELGLFRDGVPGAGYPVERLGYMEVGRVEASRNPAIPEGAVVATTCGHRTEHVHVPGAERVVVLPEGMDPLLGIWVAHMGPICANGLLHAAHDWMGTRVESLGDGVRGKKVLVVGDGVVGLLVASFADWLGAEEVVVSGVVEERLAAARGLGLRTLDERAKPIWDVCKREWVHGPRDRGADVVFQCRGETAALAAALRSLRPQGTVIDLGFYQGGADAVRLGEEFHHNGLSLRCAQIGRVPRGLAPAWDRDRLSAETIGLLADRGDRLREHLVSDIVPFEEGPQLFADVAAWRRHVLQAVFAMPAATGTDLAAEMARSHAPLPLAE